VFERKNNRVKEGSEMT